MLVHSLASKYARFVVLVRQMYWTPLQITGPPLLKSDDLFFREPIDIGPPPFKNPGHAPAHSGTHAVMNCIADTKCFYNGVVGIFQFLKILVSNLRSETRRFP